MAFLIYHSSPFLAFHMSSEAYTGQSLITYAVRDCQLLHLSLGHFMVCGPRNLAPLSRMLWAACCLDFFGFVRAGEFTSAPADDYPSLLSAADISVDSISEPKALIVHLKHSKTDPFQAGCCIHLGRTYQLLCPVAALLGYLAVRPSYSKPSFYPWRWVSSVQTSPSIQVTGNSSTGWDPDRWLYRP